MKLKKVICLAAVVTLSMVPEFAGAQTLGEAATVSAVEGAATQTVVSPPAPATTAPGAAPGSAPAAAAASTPATTASTPATTASTPATTASTPPSGATPSAAAGEAVPAPEASLGGMDDPFRQSFFFSALDLVSIERAVRQQTVPGQEMLGKKGEPIPMVRQITLQGVAYKNPKQWVVWINGQKVEPGFMLKEIVDIQVERDAVHLKWFDIGLNGVLNITLHPHETYDIVSGILLPG